MVERGVDGVAGGGDPASEANERWDPAAARPGQPAIQRILADLAFGNEHVAQAFLEEIRAVQPRVCLGDPGQLLALTIGEFVGVLPQGVAGSLEPPGVAGGHPQRVSVTLGLAGGAGVVPGLAADIIKGFDGPLDDVKRVSALNRARTALRDDFGDPRGLIGRNMRDSHASDRPETIKEAAQGGAIMTGSGPQQSAGVVIDDDSQIPVAALVGDLIDPDTRQSVQAVAERFNISPDPGDDRPHRPPRDPHQLRDRGL